MHGAPTLDEQMRPNAATPPPQHAWLPVKKSPPSLALQPTPECNNTLWVQGEHKRRSRLARRSLEQLVMANATLYDGTTNTSTHRDPRTSASPAADRAADVVGQDPGNIDGTHLVCLHRKKNDGIPCQRFGCDRHGDSIAHSGQKGGVLP